MKGILIPAALASIICFGSAAAENLVLNGSFESGDFQLWNVSGAHTGVSCCFDPPDGTYVAYFGAGVPQAIFQYVADTPGQLYQLSGWYAGSEDNSLVQASQLIVRVNNDYILDITPVPSDDIYRKFSGYFVGTGQELLYVQSYQVQAVTFVDNLSITAAVAPEASTWTMMLLGFGGLGFAGYRRRASRLA